MYRVLSNVLHEGTLFEKGQEADFDEKSAKELLLAGAIEEIKATKVVKEPKPKQEPKAKAEPKEKTDVPPVTEPKTDTPKEA